MAGLRAQFGILGPALRAGFLRGAPGALTVFPGLPPGSLDSVRRDLGGQGCLMATMGDVLLQPRRRTHDGPRGDAVTCATRAVRREGT